MSNLDISNIKVLIVDDNAFMRRILMHILQGLHVRKIVQAADGADAFDKLQNFEPDIILVDWEMTSVDGLEFIKMIRNDDRKQDRFIPIILVTAHSQEYRVMQARDAGINEMLIKPVSAELLYKRIQAVVERPRPFVDAPDFFGPDRRRRQVKFLGIDRRHAEMEIIFADT